ncbi:hypothetical protein SCOR_18885 [Sulfidibacter corallicola]
MHWPSIDHFGVEGHHQHDLRLRLAEKEIDEHGSLIMPKKPFWIRNNEERALFWKRFADDTLRPIGLEILKYYSSFFRIRWSDYEPNYYYSLYWLEDAPEKYADIGLRVHTHYDHDPFWAVSCLFYLNEGNKVISGTNLQSIQTTENPESECDIALNSRRWYTDERIKPVERFDFKKNRLVTFVDGPLSFHGVDRYASHDSDVELERKAILIHLALHPKHFNEHYGMDRNAFMSKVMSHSVDQDLFRIVKSDVKRYKDAVARFRPFESSDYARGITLHGYRSG